MPITMQGSWTVAVKSKEAAYAQRFIISGATSGNGTYAGVVSTPPVLVTGNNWVITIQNNPGTGFVDSDVQIKFPSVSGGQYRFDIESNDTWVGDQDFDDLILTCSTPQTVSDFLLYGNVSYYGAGCAFNPCFRRWIVIDSRVALAEALRNPLLKQAIEKYYPDRLWVEPPHIGPTPDPPPIRPLVIPIDEGFAIPPKQAQVLTISQNQAKVARVKAKTDAAQEAPVQSSILASRTVTLSSPTMAKLDIDRIAVGRFIDRVIRFCETGPLPGVVLRFQEYDRTNAELAGGAYTGEGNRENLGVCATDRNGNYIFRFSRSIARFLEEADVDVAVGEDEVVQAQPDVIVQVLDPAATTGVAYESAPYWNVPLIKRVNICVPKGNLGRLPTACQGENAIQAIGNIFIGAPQLGGSRVGFNNFLGVEGRITAKNTLPSTPQARCAAWAGNLDFFACFLDQPTVKYYTIRFRRKLPDLSWSPWMFFQQEYRHPKIANIHLPNYNGDLVGPLPGAIPLHIDGGAAVPAPTYLNIENDNAWVFTHRDRKAVISSWLYAPEPGIAEFRIEGYDSAGNKINVAQDAIRLFIDNSVPDFQITDVKMLGQAGGDCALFTLPADQFNAPLTVKFKANQMQGFMNDYGLSVRKGNTTGFVISGAGPGAISGAYVHGDDLLCNQLEGTLDDPTCDGFGVVRANIGPVGVGNWLEANQPFCTFAVNLSCSTRVTNGYNVAVYGYGPTQYLLGIQK